MADPLPDLSPNWTWLSSTLPCDCVHAFPVKEGGTLLVGPGEIRCRVGLGKVRGIWEGIDNDREGAETSTWIEACVELAGPDRRVFRCTRLVRTYTFILAGTLGDCDVRSPAFDGLDPLFKDVRSGFEERITTVFTLKEIGTSRAVAYYLRHGGRFDLWIEKRAQSTDRLVVELYDSGSGGFRDGPRPALTFATDLAASIVLWPLLIHPGPWYSPLPQLFELTDGQAEPQPLVEWLP